MKITNLVILCIGLIAPALVCCTNQSAARASQVMTSSPGRTYTVQFEESVESQQGLMFDNRVVKFSLTKHGATVFNQELFSREKVDKPPFSQKYPRLDWRAENILRLGGDSLPESSCDEIIVTNLTSKEIAYFDVITFQPERFIIFDLQPKSTVRLYAYPENDATIADQPFLVGGKFSDGQDIKTREVSFSRRANLPTVAHYCISISDEGIFMNSIEYDGMIYDYTGTVEGLRKASPGELSPKEIPVPAKILIPKGNCKN